MADSTLLSQTIQNASSAAHHLVSETPNPYYPIGSSIANYAANEWSVPALLGLFFGTCVLLFGTTHALVKRIGPKLTTSELVTIMWFVLSGCIHVFFEGYYVLNFTALGSLQHPIAQMWKEYAFSDSRYLTQNSFVLCMETVTAIVWGPWCLLVAALIVKGSPWRYPMQMIVSMGQFYGDFLYYATCLFDHQVHGLSYSRPEAVYFWFYFVLMNLFWIVIPGGKCCAREARTRLY